MRALLAALLVCLPWLGAAHIHAQPAAKTLTVALGHEPDRFYDPQILAGQLVANLVFDPLVGLDDQMQPYPVLAEAIPAPDNNLVQLSGDGGDRRLVVSMPLRQGVTWSDGEPFTADDVVYTWQLMMNPQSGFETPVEDKLKSVDKVDDYTVRFVYLSANEAKALDPERYKDQGTEPVIDPLYPFGLYDAPAIYPRHILRQFIGDDPRHSPQVAGLADADFAHNPVGTGPYVLANWTAGTSLTFASRGAGLPQRQAQPAIDTVVFRIMPDKNDSLTALSSSQVQVVAEDNLDPTDAAVLDSLPGVQARYTAGNAAEQLTFNLDNPILADASVRQAIGYGINRPALNDAIFFGKGVVPTSQVPAWSWAYAPNLVQYDYDPGKANQLLDKAGWTRPGSDAIREKNGQRLSLKYWSTPASFRPGLMAMVKDQLAQVGIELNVDVIPSSTLFDVSPSAPQALVSRQFDMAEFAWVNGYDASADALYSMHSASIPTKANAYRGGNYGDYHNPRIDQLLNQATSSLDPNARTAALAEAQAIWQSDLPELPLLLRPIVTATSPNVQNFRPTPAAAGETWNIEQWDLAPAAPQ